MTKKEGEGLSPAEWKIMKVVWERKSCAARDVYDAVKTTLGWSPSTAKTYLRRLVDKGHLKTKQVGNCYLYEPVTSAYKMARKAADVLIENTKDELLAPLIVHMVKKGKLSPENIQKMREILDEYEEAQSEEKE